MSISGISNIGLSGALAQTQRLSVTANNVANIRTTGAIPAADGTVSAGQNQAYQPQTAAQVAVTGANGQGQGTRAVSTLTNPSYVQEYQPDSPDANADGLVAAPNVDIATETVNQMSGLRAYQANLATIATADEMARSVLDMKA